MSEMRIDQNLLITIDLAMCFFAYGNVIANLEFAQCVGKVLIKRRQKNKQKNFFYRVKQL